MRVRVNRYSYYPAVYRAIVLLLALYSIEACADLSSRLLAPTRLPEMWIPTDNLAIWPDAMAQLPLVSPFGQTVAPSHLLDFIGSEALANTDISNLLNPQAVHAFSEDRRTKAEQAIYNAELESKDNVSLHDKPLDCASISPYCDFLELTNGQTLFSLNGSQAADCDDAMLWEYWFDNVTHPDVKNRYEQVTGFLKSHGLNMH